MEQEFKIHTEFVFSTSPATSLVCRGGGLFFCFCYFHVYMYIFVVNELQHLKPVMFHFLSAHSSSILLLFFWRLLVLFVLIRYMIWKYIQLYSLQIADIMTDEILKYNPIVPSCFELLVDFLFHALLSLVESHVHHNSLS